MNNRVVYTKCLLYTVFSIISILFLAVFSSSTSPLFNTYGGDSAIFILLGKLNLSGKIPYVDFFDHKGPILILIESLGLLLFSNDRTGIFILQVINLTMVQFLTFRIALHYLSIEKSICVVFLTLLLFSFTIQGGNLTEEFSIPLLLLSLYLTLQFLTAEKLCISSMNIFWLGISASLLFWMRSNNIGINVACVMFIAFVLVRNKNHKKLAVLMIYYSLGFLVVMIPLLVYFIHLKALHEMLYASIFFNLKYINLKVKADLFSEIDSIKDLILYLIKAWGVLIILLIGVIIYYRQMRDVRILALAIYLFIFSTISTQIGMSYYHYMTLNIPCFVLGVTFILYSCGKKTDVLLIVISVILLFGYSIFKYTYKVYREDQDDTVFIQNSKDLISHVPLSERNSVYAYDVHTRFYLITNITPVYNFFTKQEWHGLHDVKIFEDINKWIDVNHPMWVVLSSRDVGDLPINRYFYNIIYTNYFETYRNNDLILYRCIKIMDKEV